MHNRTPIFGNSYMRAAKISQRIANPRLSMSPRFPARTNWLIPAALVFLALVPVLAGAARLSDLATGTPTAETARFHAAPLPVILHILGATLYALIGVFQFSRTPHRRSHRIAGRIALPMGLIAALSGIWMTLTYPWANADGWAVYLARLIFGTAMSVSLILGLTAAVKRNIPAHKAWMLRAYAIGMGAGTQVLTHLPWFIPVGKPTEAPRAVLMIAGWVLNLTVAEWIIHKQNGASNPRPTRRPFLNAS
jgi:uncharacterized membrane protein